MAVEPSNKKSYEILALIIAFASLIIAILAWQHPYAPNSTSPEPSPTKIALVGTPITTSSTEAIIKTDNSSLSTTSITPVAKPSEPTPTLTPTLTSIPVSSKTPPQPTPKTVITKPSFVNTKVTIEAMDKGSQWTGFPDYPVKLFSNGRSFSSRTNQDGVAQFNSVPCGNNVTITVYNGRGGEWSFSRYLKCETGIVNLGKYQKDMEW